jgi:hypothetical protein
MIIRSYLVTLWALLFVSCGPTVAQPVAVFTRGAAAAPPSLAKNFRRPMVLHAARTARADEVIE